MRSDLHSIANAATADHDPTVEIVIPDGYTWFFISNATDKIDTILSEKLSWRDPNAHYTKKYKRGEWDGYNRLYHEENHMAPIGLLDRAIEALEECGYEPTVISKGDRSGDAISTTWNFPHTLREYQRDAIEDTLQAGGGIISLPTGAGKTVTALRLINRIEQRTLVFVHTKELLYQWAERAEETLNVEVGRIGDDLWSEGDVTIASMQTIHERGLENLNESYGIIICDECHRTSAAETMQDICLDIDIEWRIGLSATPWRAVNGEELEIEAGVGSVASEISAERLISEGYLAEPTFEILEPATDRIPDTTEEYTDVVRRCIELAPGRNMKLARKAKSLAEDGHKVLVTVNRIAQGKLIEYALSPEAAKHKTHARIIDEDDDIHRKRMTKRAIEDIQPVDSPSATFLDASAATTERQKTIDEFENGETDILITTLLREGADIPNISAIVLGEGGKSKVEKIQRIGRALRPKNGEKAVIVDIADQGKYLNDHFKKRKKVFKEYYGAYGPGDGYSKREQEVKSFLEENGIRTEACRIEETDSGIVEIELTEYLGGHEFERFKSVMRDSPDIWFDGSKNIYEPPVGSSKSTT